MDRLPCLIPGEEGCDVGARWCPIAPGCGTSRSAAPGWKRRARAARTHARGSLGKRVRPGPQCPGVRASSAREAPARGAMAGQESASRSAGHGCARVVHAPAPGWVGEQIAVRHASARRVSRAGLARRMPRRHPCSKRPRRHPRRSPPPHVRRPSAPASFAPTAPASVARRAPLPQRAPSAPPGVRGPSAPRRPPRRAPPTPARQSPRSHPRADRPSSSAARTSATASSGATPSCRTVRA